MKLKTGCCGFPESRERYYRHFSAVELQSTFYSLPELELAEKWRAGAPGNFEFTVKASQLITHPPESPTYRRAKLEIAAKDKAKFGLFRPAQEVFDAWDETREICKALRARIVLLQTPASFTASEENLVNMHNFFSRIERSNLEIAWEPRGKWDKETIKDLCKRYDLIHCVDPFASSPLHFRKAIYFRLHGSPTGKKMYSHRYSDEDLQMLYQKLRDYANANDDKGIYCMFNNISMWQDALRLKALL